MKLKAITFLSNNLKLVKSNQFSILFLFSNIRVAIRVAANFNLAISAANHDLAEHLGCCALLM